MSFIQQFFTSRDNNANAETFVGQEGRLWWDPVTDVLSIYETSSSSWVAVGGGGSGSAVNDWGLVNGAVTATNDYGSIT